LIVIAINSGLPPNNKGNIGKTLKVATPSSRWQQQQAEYYQMLSLADQSADCSGFIEFMLNAIRVSLQQAVATEQ